MFLVLGEGEDKEAVILRIRYRRDLRSAKRMQNSRKSAPVPDHKDVSSVPRLDGLDQVIRFAQRNCHRLQLPLLSQRLGGLLRTLQIGCVDLLNIGIREHLRKARRAAVSFGAEQRVGRVGNFVSMAYQKYRAHSLAMTAARERQDEKKAQGCTS